MSESTPPLPDFGQPPVVEVALSVQFNRLEALRSAHYGLFWSKLRPQGFTRTEDHAPIDPSIEGFGLQQISAEVGVQIRTYQVPLLPRVWFLNDTGTQLIQLQPDRFTHNWRKLVEHDQYVRYPRIREGFLTELQRFSEFVSSEDLGKLRFTQCEITYVNHFVSGQGWEHHGELGNSLAFWSGTGSDEFLPVPEGSALSAHYLIHKSDRPVGRLHIDVQPGYRIADSKPIFIANLTARGAPLGLNTEAVLAFLDLGREWVVRGFASMTTGKMHELWRRTDVR